MSIKDKILLKMPTDLNDLEKARYLYIELGKLVSFSTKFQNTNDINFLDMMIKNVSIDKFNKNQVNCSMWSQLYSQLLNEVNIKNQIIDFGHKYIEFYINDTRWVADATYETYNDLARIQNDDQTLCFGPARFKFDNHSNDIVLDKNTLDLLNNIDLKLGYNTDKKENIIELKQFLNQIKNGNFDIKTISNNNEIDDELVLKIEFLFTKLGVLNLGFYESKDYVREIETYLLTEDEKDRVKGIELKRTNSDYEVDIVQCIYIYGEKQIYYYLLAPNLPIKRVTKENIIELSLLGYGIENKVIPGIDFPKKFVLGKISNKKIYKLNRKKISKEILKYDEEQSRKI